MKIIVKNNKIILLSMLLSSCVYGSSLAGIELGSDNYIASCEKIKSIINKNEPKMEFKYTKNSCGYDFGNQLIGLKSSNGKTIDYIGVKTAYFGFTTMDGPTTVAQAYIGRSDAVTKELIPSERNSKYFGVNEYTKERVTIDFSVMAIFKEENKSSAFDIK